MGVTASRLQAKSAEVTIGVKNNLTTNDSQDTAKVSGCPFKHDQANTSTKSECPVTGASTDDINLLNMVRSHFNLVQ